MKSSKNLISFFSSVAIVASMSAGISVSAAEVSVYPDTMVNFSVKDNSGNFLDSASMQIIDESGNVVASWSGNNSSSMSSDYSCAGDFKKSVGDFIDVPELTGEVVSNVYIDGHGNFDMTDTFEFRCGTEYNATVTYKENTPVSLTVPANKMLLNVDSNFAGRTYEYGVGIGPDIMSKEVYNFNDIAGKETLYDLPAGKHDAYTCIGGAGGSGGSVNVKDTPVNYVKQTINLHEKFPSYFNADGTTTVTMSGETFDISYANDADGKCAILYIISGSVVNAVVPDSNANVTIYVEQGAERVSVSTNFSYKSTVGGGKNGMSADLSNQYTVNIKTPALPGTGITLTDIKPGNYTLRQTNAVSGYEKPADVKFTVKDTEELQSVSIVNDKIVQTTTVTTVTPAVTTTTAKPVTTVTTATSQTTTSVSNSTVTTTSTSKVTTSASTTARTTTAVTTTKAKENNSPATGDKGIAGALFGMIAAACVAIKKKK